MTRENLTSRQAPDEQVAVFDVDSARIGLHQAVQQPGGCDPQMKIILDFLHGDLLWNVVIHRNQSIRTKACATLSRRHVNLVNHNSKVVLTSRAYII